MAFFIPCYVYKHTRVDTREIFYIGIGLGDRAYDTYNRNRFWKKIYRETSINIEIIEDGISWNDACIKEIKLIAHYGRKDKGLGPLVNLTDGGEGCLGRIVLPETIEKIRKFQVGRVKSQETRDKLSAAHRGKKKTPQHVENSKAAKAKNTNLGWYQRKSVICTITGEEFKCIKDAAPYAKVSKQHLAAMLRGDKTNYSTLIYKPSI